MCGIFCLFDVPHWDGSAVGLIVVADVHPGDSDEQFVAVDEHFHAAAPGPAAGCLLLHFQVRLRINRKNGWFTFHYITIRWRILFGDISIVYVIILIGEALRDWRAIFDRMS